MAHARLKPSGAKIAWVKIGSVPCRIACGHQANDQMKICGSVKSPPTKSRSGWSTTGIPRNRNATSR